MELKICHLYPEVLNLYGDRGNILCMKRRLETRGISCSVTDVGIGDDPDLTQFDLFFIGTLHLGVAGAGYGTACANVIRCSATVIYLARATDIYKSNYNQLYLYIID